MLHISWKIRVTIVCAQSSTNVIKQASCLAKIFIKAHISEHKRHNGANVLAFLQGFLIALPACLQVNAHKLAIDTLVKETNFSLATYSFYPTQ